MNRSDVVQFEQAEPDNAVCCTARQNEIGLKSGSWEFVETGHEIIDLIPAFF